MKRFPTSLVVAARILFAFFMLICLGLLLYGIPTLVGSFTNGYIGVQLNRNADGYWTLDPAAGREAAGKGIVSGDILMAVDGKPIPTTTLDPSKLIIGPVGQPVTITVQKADGSLSDVAIIRSEQYQARLSSAGLTPGGLAAFYVATSLLVGFAFAILAGRLMRKPEPIQLAVLAGFLLLLFPYSLNAAGMAHDGSIALNLTWLYNLLRAGGIFLTFWLLLVFPDGHFSPGWMKWGLWIVGVWMVPYYIGLVIPYLPSNAIDAVWIVIIAVGVINQVYHQRHLANRQLRPAPVVQAAAIALGTYVLVWVVSRFVITAFSNPLQIWFSLLGEILVDLVLLFFGWNLFKSLRKTN